MNAKYAFLLLGWCTFANAQTACPDVGTIDPTTNPTLAFDDLRRDDVLGGSGCNTELCEAVAEWKRVIESEGRMSAASDLLGRIRVAAESLPGSQPGVETIQNRLVDWQAQFAEVEGNIETLSTAEWQPAGFVLFKGHPDEIDFEKIFNEECPGSIGQCTELFATAACVYTVAVLQRTILQGLLEERRNDTLAYLDLLNRRWSAYNSGGRSLFPWELWVNGALYERKHGGRGFVEPPTRQLLLLHPSMAIAGQDSPDGDFEETLVLEFVGWYGWRWGGRDGATMRWPVGASLITAWDGSNELGYGVMIHLPKNWSIGATRKSVGGSHETSILVSIDLGKWLMEENSLRNRLIDNISGTAP
jgi:hypothetical protein